VTGFLFPIDEVSRTRWVRAFGRIVVIGLVWAMTSTAMAGETCRMEQPSEPLPNMMVRTLTGNCSDDDRKSLAIPTHVVLEAIENGHGVQLEGVMLSGDLLLDALPLVPVAEIQHVPALVKERFDREQLTAVRMIRGPLLLHRVDVQGIIATNLVRQGYLIVQGPVSITESTIRRSIDFSRAIFQEKVDFSKTIIGYEGFFILAMFQKDAQFAKTVFGTHSRFHKAVFWENAIFQDAVFHGVAEFLEVGFQQQADFSNTRFVQGTGFSGSQFRQMPDFSKADFEREAFFRFAQFHQGVLFRQGMFRKTADFTESAFNGKADFSGVLFEEVPQFTDQTLAGQFRKVAALRDPKIQVGLFVLASLTLVFFYFLFRRIKVKESSKI